MHPLLFLEYRPVRHGYSQHAARVLAELSEALAKTRHALISFLVLSLPTGDLP